MTDPGTDTEIIRWQTAPDGILVLTMDAPGQSANTLSEQFVTALTETVARLRDEREHITGVVLTSAKKTFFAGGDLNELVALRREEIHVSAWQFLKLGWIVMIPALLLALAALMI